MLGIYGQLKYANAKVAAWATLGPFVCAILLFIFTMVHANTSQAEEMIFDSMGFVALVFGAFCLLSLGTLLSVENMHRKRRFEHRYISIFTASRGYQEASYFAAITASLMLAATGGMSLVAGLLWIGITFAQ